MIKIVTDSTVQLSNEEIEKYGITIIPLNIIIANKNYRDGIDLTKDDFISVMKDSHSHPTTSQPSVGEIAAIYDEVSKDGDDILSIHVASSLSGTFNAAVQGAHLSTGNVAVFDSHFIDRPLAYQVIIAAKMARNGKSMSEIIQHLEKIRKESLFYISVIHLDNLIRSGRVSHLMGRLSILLNIKLVLKWSESGLSVDAKGRGLKTISKRMEKVLGKMEASGPLSEIGFSHAGLSDFSGKWLEELKKRFPDVPIFIGKASPALLVHAGEEAFGITYLPKKVDFLENDNKKGSSK